MEIAEQILQAVRKARPDASAVVEPESLVVADGVTYALVVTGGEPALCVAGSEGAAKGFQETTAISVPGMTVAMCPLAHANAVELHRRLPFTAPSPVGRGRATIGLGDRLGLAGRGHIRAVRGFRVSPVLAQQSVRELTLTSRCFADVLDSSTWAVFAEGYRLPWGADGDHLKSEDKVRESLEAGFTMITADVSDSLGIRFAAASDAELAEAYGKLDAGYRKEIEGRYLAHPFALAPGGEIRFDAVQLQRAALIYGEAIRHAARLYRTAEEARGAGAFDFELSIDETDTPTTPQAHLFMAMEARRIGIAFTSLAPRFVGEFQKGIDYIGDVPEFERSFSAHAAVATTLGYRISVHSGSDKFAVFPAVGRLSGGRFHVKTAGTSWLESLRVVAAADPQLFRELYTGALCGYTKARKLYHVTPDLSTLPAAEDTARITKALLDDVNARRVLHIAYGELLAVPRLKERLFALLRREAGAYSSALQAHIGRHLSLLGVERAEGECPP